MAGNLTPQIINEEHEASLNPPTRRVLNYGYDGTQKNVFYVDNNGTLRSIVTIASNLTVSSTLGANATYGNVTVTQTATQILPSDTTRRSFIVQNLSSATVFIGTTSGVTSSNGISLKTDDSLVLDNYDGVIFAIADSTGHPLRFLAELD